MADGSGSSAAATGPSGRQLHPVEGGDHRRRPDARRHEGQDDRVALDEVAEVHALRSGLGQRGQGQRGAGDGGRAGLGDEEAGEGLVAVHAHEGVAAVAEHGEQLRVRQVVERGHVEQVGVDLVDEVGGQLRQRVTQATDPPGGPEAPGRRSRIEAAEEAAGLGVGTDGGEVGGGHAVDGDDERAAADGLGGTDAREQQRLAQAVAERARARGPARGWRAARGRTRRPGRDRRRGRWRATSVVIGPGLEQDDRAVVVDGPLEVLRAAVGGGGGGGEPGQAAQRLGGRPEGAVGSAGADLADAAAAVEHGGPAVDLAADEGVGTAGHRGHDEAVVPAGDGIGAEEHAAPARLEHRLDEHGHRGVDHAGLTGGGRGAEHGGERLAEGALVADVEHGLEHAGHRGGGAVLAGRGGAHHDGVGAVGGHGPPGLQGAGVVRGRPAGGEHHAGERGKPGVAGASQVGRLGPGVGGIGGRGVVERDDGGSGGRGHGRIFRVGADGTLTRPDLARSAACERRQGRYTWAPPSTAAGRRRFPREA